MKFEKNELRVAVFVIVPVAILLLFIVLKLGYSISGSTIDVFLKVDSITAIKKGTQVKIKGYPIGRVISITPVYKPALHFLAMMRIENNIDLYEDCSAIILNQNVIGDPVIELRNAEKMGELLRNGSVIEGIEYVNLEVIIQDIHALLTNLTSTVGGIKDITFESKGNLRNLISKLSASATTLSSMLMNSQKDIGAILESFRNTSKTMNDISEELKKHPLTFIFKKDDKKSEKKEEKKDTKK